MTQTERAIILGISTEVGEVGADITLAALIDQDAVTVAGVMDSLIQRGMLDSYDGEHFPTATAIRMAYEVQA